MKNENLQHIDKQHIWHPFDAIDTDKNIYVEKAEGIYLYDTEGRKTIDAISSWWVNIHGHCHPRLVKALITQAQTLEHVIFSGFTHSPAIAFTEKLINVTNNIFSKVFFSDNGSTAIEVALKMAFQYWHNKGIKRTKVLAMEGAYHGDTFGAMAAGDRSKFNEPFFPFLFDVDFIPFPSKDTEDEILSLIEAKLSSQEYASFIFEPLIQGASGMRTYSADFMEKAIETSNKYHTITIADEVFTGFYRTGKMFAYQHLENVTPDIACLSKAITGGFMPLGASLCKEFIYEEFHTNDIYKTFFHGHSYTGNPLALAVANASLSLLLENDTLQNISRIVASQKRFAESLASKFHFVNVRNLGTIVSIEILSENTVGYFSNLKETIYHYFLSKNILLRPLGNVIYFLPMYCFSEQDLGLVYDEIDLFLKKIEAKEL